MINYTFYNKCEKNLFIRRGICLFWFSLKILFPKFVRNENYKQ